MRRIDLGPASWTIEACGDLSHAPPAARGRTFHSAVPGCVHSDLIRAAVIGHPDMALNEESSQWIGRTDWRYRCRFELDAESLAHERIDLVLDGLDTIAEIDINGQPVDGTPAMNIHHAHRFVIRSLLRAGHNELVITLRGPVAYVAEQERRLGARPVNGDWTPYCYVRKMASNFQWDWGPRVATCGIWRAARIEAWSGARIAGVRPIIMRATHNQAEVHVHITCEFACETPQTVDCTATLSLAQRPLATASVTGIERHGSCRLLVDRPSRWWPRGFGEQPLHDLHVVLSREGRTIDEHRCRLGLRQTRLITEPDQHGESFAIEINGLPIFCKGANWIPEGLFPEDQSPQRIRERVRQAADANMNMLRVWGGGTYEQDAFYDACDELGIMVWQDFMFACATYPEDDPYPALIEREAREAVSRLVHHPSIVLWCGGNENVVGRESWGWKQRMPPDQKWGERYFFDILPRVVEELDPSRPHWPDSPTSGSRDAHPNDPDRGDRHTWDAKVEEYRGIVPRFCSEFGHQAPPCWATMRQMWGEDQLQIDSRAMIHRQRAGAQGGDNSLWYGPKIMGDRFETPTNFDDWFYQAHVLQAKAISIGIEWMRANQPRCMGALFWQLNDAWAGHSWSCIDSAGRLKPLWYAVRRSFAPRLLTIQPFKDGLRLVAINETPEPWAGRLNIQRSRFSGECVASESVDVRIDPRDVRHFLLSPEIARNGLDRTNVHLLATTDDVDVAPACWFFDHDRVLELPRPAFDATIDRSGEHVLLHLHARTLLKDVVISVDRVDSQATISDNLFTMLAGESCTLRIRTNIDVPAERWTSPPVLMCANVFASGRGEH